MKSYDVCGIGNAITDLLLEVSEEDFAKLELRRGSSLLVDAEKQAEILDGLNIDNAVLASGGSVANSLVAISQLDGNTAFLCCLGDDRFGGHYRRQFDDLGVVLGVNPLKDQPSGSTLALITPDAERTMQTCLAASALLGPEHISREIIDASSWLFIEGYLFANPGSGQQAISRAVEYALESGCKIALTFSESWVVETQKDALARVVDRAELIFANQTEACAYTGEKTLEKAFDKLRERVPGVAITAGARGAFVSYGSESVQVDGFACEPKDLTGAGDMFAGALLYGLVKGIDLEKCAKAACYLAMNVVSQVGPRLPSGTRQLWEKAMTM